MAPPTLTQAAPAAPQLDTPKMLVGEHTLPASWWTSESIFELEKRAIFHKSWMFCTHSSRFAKAGDYYAFNLAGINFSLSSPRLMGN